MDFSLRRAHLPFARVLMDNPAAGRLAAEHFLQRGFQNFLFYSASANWTFEERGQGFVDALREHGRNCQCIKWHEAKRHEVSREEWSHRRAWLTRALKAAPKPLAVFTANGTLALEVREICEAAGIEIPRQVACVGVEDDLLLPQSMLRSITTIDPHLEEQGYQGAALLDRLMAGAPIPAKPIRIQPARIITRQ